MIPRLPMACKSTSSINLYRKCLFNIFFPLIFVATLGFKSRFMSLCGEVFLFFVCLGRDKEEQEKKQGKLPLKSAV